MTGRAFREAPTLQDQVAALERANHDQAVELGVAQSDVVELLYQLHDVQSHLDWHHPGGVCLDGDVTPRPVR